MKAFILIVSQHVGCEIVLNSRVCYIDKYLSNIDEMDTILIGLY